MRVLPRLAASRSNMALVWRMGRHQRRVPHRRRVLEDGSVYRARQSIPLARRRRLHGLRIHVFVDRAYDSPPFPSVLDPHDVGWLHMGHLAWIRALVHCISLWRHCRLLHLSLFLWEITRLASQAHAFFCSHRARRLAESKITLPGPVCPVPLQRHECRPCG